MINFKNFTQEAQKISDAQQSAPPPPPPPPQRPKPIHQDNLKIFCNNPLFSDIKLIDKTSGTQYPAHKVILATRCEYFKQILSNDAALASITLPEAVKSTFQAHEGDMGPMLLNLIYQFREISEDMLLDEGMLPNNVMLYYSALHSLGMHKEMQLVRNFILANVLSKENCDNVFLDSIQFQDEELKSHARHQILLNFYDLLQKSENKNNLLRIPFNEIIPILESEHVVIHSEDNILQFVNDYIMFREQLGENGAPQPPAAGQGSEVKPEQQKEAPIEQQKQEAPPPPPPPPPPPSAENPDQPADNQAKAPEGGQEEKQIVDPQELLANHKLSKEEQQQLLMQVRLALCSHEFLIMMVNYPSLSEFKDIFLEAISAQLNNYEKIQSIQYSVKLDPRIPKGIHVNNDQIEDGNLNSDFDTQMVLQNLGKHLMGKTGSRRELALNQHLDGSKLLNNTQDHFTQEAQDSPKVNTPQNMASNVKKPQNDINIVQNYSSMNQGSMMVPPNKNFMETNAKSKFFSPNSMMKSQQLQEKIQFVYKYDFDDNGVIFYVGTHGKTRKWSNPHSNGMVQVFMSSLRVGRLQDLVSREITNLSTQNEKNSFMGVDLGVDRYLFPTCYTIRNRNSTTHVMLNWVLEASIDGIQWLIIDQRIHFSEDSAFNLMMENERELLQERGSSSTWGLDTKAIKTILDEIPNNPGGFRAFQLTQIFKNSHGSDNMCLSNFEIYGNAFGTKWYFM